MTTKNSVLLIVKQFPGIEYNGVLNKISGNYGSVNSARAALSRALKDMNALGWIAKRDNHWFVTDKGQLILNSEMKNKLLFRLNQTVHEEPLSEIDSIVEQLSILIERSKNDPDLLKAAKNAIRFSLSDLSSISEKVKARQSQLLYLSEVLEKQIKSLQELDFFDTRMVSPREKTLSLLQDIASKTNASELFLSAAPMVIEPLAAQLNEKPAQDNLTITQKNFPAFFDYLAGQFQQEQLLPLTITVAPYTIRITNTQASVTAPYAKLHEL